MSWHELLYTQGPITVGALLRFGVAYLNARTNKLNQQPEEG
jgi:hypothetical protein